MRSKKLMFLKLHLKKALKLLPTILIITAITLASIAVVGATLLLKYVSSEDKAMANVGVVGDADNSYLGIGIGAIKTFDDSKEYLNIITMTEDEALSAMKSGEINGYVSLPEGFVEDIVYGENTPAQFIYMDGPRGLGSVIMNEVIGSVSTFVTQTQTAVYAQRAAMREIRRAEKLEGSSETDSEFSDRLEKTTMDINLDFFDLVIHRAKLYDILYVGSLSGLSFVAYYICALILVFLLIWGMSCNKLLGYKNIDFARLMNRSGIKSPLQILYEFFAFLVVTLLILFVTAIPFGILVSNVDLGITELADANVLTCLLFVIKALPSIITIIMMHIMIYELFSTPISALLAEFLLAMGLSYVSGCLYPITFFPVAIQKCSSFLPTGAAFSYMRNLLSGNNVSFDLILCLIYTGVFFAVSVLIRKIKITGESR